MYIEIFILDNLLMDLLILRLAAALLEVRPPLFRQLGAGLVSALIAALAAFAVPALYSPWLRLPQLIPLCLGLPAKGPRGFAKALAALLFSSLAVGGCALAAAVLTGGGLNAGFVSGGISLRCALAGALAASFMPGAARKMLRRRLPKELSAELRIFTGSSEHVFTAAIDTGNRLTEPVTGLPVAIIRCAELEKRASLPIPAVTPAGSSVLWGFRPRRALVNGRPAALVVALTREALPAEAIIPPEVLP